MSVVSLADAKAAKVAVKLNIVLPADVLPGLRRWAREMEKQMTGVMTDEVAAAAAVSCFIDTIEKMNAAKESGQS